MGNCLACFKVDQVPQHIRQTDTNYIQNSTTFQSPQDNRRYKSPLRRGNPGYFKRKSSVPPVDTQGNRSHHHFIMPEKRSFYSCISSLSKSDGKKGSSKDCSESKINFLFEQYKDSNFDSILSEGIIKFCADLDVKPDDFRILIIAWKFDAETMCCFTREEFVNGCKNLRVDSIKGIQSKFPELLREVNHHENFKDLYRYTFKFGLDTESGQRILPSDIAILLWKLVFSQREPRILNRWIGFLEDHPSICGIPRDTWYMFLNFTEIVGDNLSGYDETEAWPSLFDDFVEYENDQLNQNISKDQKMDD